MQQNQLSDALGYIYEVLSLGDLVGEDICIVLVQLLLCDGEPLDFRHDFGRKRAVEQVQRPGTGQSLHSGERTGHETLTGAFGAHQHLGYQIALEVQFVEDFGSVGMGPDIKSGGEVNSEFFYLWAEPVRNSILAVGKSAYKPKLGDSHAFRI